jgi:biofilm protein TabA
VKSITLTIPKTGSEEDSMILGSIQNLERDKKTLPKVLLRGLEYIKNTDLSKLPGGRYEIDGSMFVLVQDNQTAPRAERKAEAHRKYIDIQYVYSGSEIIGYGLTGPENEVADDQLENKDAIYFRNVKNEIELILTPGRYAIFFPTDVHRPGCAYGPPAPVRKVVIKVAADSL